MSQFKQMNQLIHSIFLKRFLDFVLSSDSSEPDSSEPTQKHLFNLSQLFKLT